MGLKACVASAAEPVVPPARPTGADPGGSGDDMLASDQQGSASGLAAY